MNLLDYIRAKHNFILKLGFVLLASFIIARQQPLKEVRGHQVDAFDAVWPYRDLVLDEDFYIKKNEKELKEEYSAVEAASPLFFETNHSDRNRRRSELDLLKASHPALYQVLKPVFDSIYNRGVIESLTPELAARPIFLNDGNYAEQVFYYNYFTLQSALEFLNGSLNKAMEKNSALRTELERSGKDPVDFLAVSFFLNKEKTRQFLNNRLAQVALYKNVVRSKEVLVKQGEPLTNQKRFLINEYLKNSNQQMKASILNFLSRWLVFFIVLAVLLLYLAFFRKTIFGQNKQVFFLFSVVTLCATATWVFYHFGLIIQAIPFCLVPILVRVFFDSRTALFTHLITMICCSFFMADKMEFILLQLVTGIVTLFVVAEMRRRQQLLNSSLVIFLSYALLFFCYQTAYGTELLAWKRTAYVPFAISSVLVLLAYPLIYITEKVFGFVSDFRLLELCDLNQPLLRQLSQEVPGTFQHSLQVANLAEEVIYYIGGNTLLVRAGAMYHDIGKLYNPRYFTENQANGFSPHIEMQPAESARVIIAHVIKGIELARQHRLPEQIIDFIRTHHGTTSVGYFLKLYQMSAVTTEAEESRFRYPGPIPFSKETAVLMLADGVEAASRSLKNHDAMAINDLVDNIIDYKIGQNQLINSDITFRDISTIRKIFKKRLMNMYHVRIEYPV